MGDGAFETAVRVDCSGLRGPFYLCVPAFDPSVLVGVLRKQVNLQNGYGQLCYFAKQAFFGLFCHVNKSSRFTLYSINGRRRHIATESETWRLDRYRATAQAT